MGTYVFHMHTIRIQYGSMCVPYGVHAVYILATHMGCNDVYRMVVQCGIHVAPIWDHMYNIYTICTQHGSKCVLYRMNRTHGLIVLMADDLPDLHINYRL